MRFEGKGQGRRAQFRLPRLAQEHFAKRPARFLLLSGQRLPRSSQQVITKLALMSSASGAGATTTSCGEAFCFSLD
jgi:hypothetical protein